VPKWSKLACGYVDAKEKDMKQPLFLLNLYPSGSAQLIQSSRLKKKASNLAEFF
jgi:hypothetical protein